MQAKALGLGGDLKGDGYQNGGALVVEKGGETLFQYVQKSAPEHASNEEILKVKKRSFLFLSWISFNKTLSNVYSLAPGLGN